MKKELAPVCIESTFIRGKAFQFYAVNGDQGVKKQQQGDDTARMFLHDWTNRAGTLRDRQEDCQS